MTYNVFGGTLNPTLYIIATTLTYMTYVDVEYLGESLTGCSYQSM